MTEDGAQVRHLAAADVFEDEPDGPEVIAERAVLGSAIQSSALAADALALLSPQHFCRNAHHVVFEAVERLAGAGEPVEPMSVMTELARTGMLAKVSGRNLGSGVVFLHSLDILDACELSNLNGALVARSELTSKVLQPLCWRGEESLALAAAAVLLGGQMPKAA